MKKQKVIRTKSRQGITLHENEPYKALEDLLEKGYQVVMCTSIGNELEYILEKDVVVNEMVINVGIDSYIHGTEIEDISNAIKKALENKIGENTEVVIR